MNRLVPILTAAQVLPLVQAAGAQASTRYWEFFVNNIRNPKTRRAYARNVVEFTPWHYAQSPKNVPKQLMRIRVLDLHADDFISCKNIVSPAVLQRIGGDGERQYQR
jgi:hypothetical protein